ncbi:MAG: hypothetical protein J5819_07000 [Eubacterium sp.]|nr:hypothetical protein [Eubacterium sp.]
MAQILHDLLYMVPLCLLALNSGEEYLSCPEKKAVFYLCALATLGICLLLKYWKNRIKYLIPAIIAVFCAALLLIRPSREWGEFLWNGRFLIWSVVAGLVGFFVGWLWVSSRIAAGCFSIAMITALVLIMIYYPATDKLIVDLAIFLPVLFVTGEIQQHWKKHGYSDKAGHMVSIAPFLIVLGVAVYFAPAPEKPYDWNFAVRIWEGTTDAIKWVGRLFTGPDEEYDAVVGFSESGSFMGNLSDTDDTVMTMSEKNDPGQAVYLRGKVMDSFDGRNWTDTYTEENRDDILDVIETLCAVNNYDPDNMSDYLRKVNLKIKFEDFNSSYIFTPIKAMPRWDHIDDKGYSQTGGNLIADEIMETGTEYTIPFYRTNNDHAVFTELLRTAPAPDEKSWEVTRAMYESQDTSRQNTDGRGSGVSDASFTAYSEYKNRIYKYYLPDTQISSNASEYLRKLTNGAETGYDRLCRIETALSAFHYTTSPGVLPEEITTPELFLDDFLFKKQEGYCSYFATAFVLMARSIGIPARYVQGFRVKKGGSDTTEVKSSMSHAWPEAYIDGVGWISFEPTPGKKRRVSWSVSNDTDQNPDRVVTPPVQPENVLPEQTTQDTEPVNKSTDFNWSIIIICVIVLIMAVLAFFIIDRALTSARYKRLSTADRFSAVCKRNYNILSFLGYKLKQGETIEEFHNRTNEKIPDSALDFLVECELIAYAGKPVGEGSLNTAINDQQDLMNFLKQEKGRYYFWYKFKLRSIK